jgi:hypothetical protein
MVNGRTPFYLTALGLGLLGAAAVFLQPYSADWPGRGYARPARAFIRAALRQDSAALVRLSASPAAVSWALDAGRTHAGSLEHWSRRLQAFAGERRGDSIEVFVYPLGEECEEAPIVLQFLGSGDETRVLRASSSCWDR